MFMPEGQRAEVCELMKIANFPAIWRLEGAPERSPFFFRTTRPSRAADSFGVPHTLREGRSWRHHLNTPRRTAVGPLLPLADDDEIDAALCVSPTRLFDRSRRESDPRRYVDTVDAPYLTIPLRRLGTGTGVGLGDFAVAIHPRAGTLCFAFVGDSREGVIAEPSLYLAGALEMGGDEEMIYLIFPGSGAGQGMIPTLDQIQARGDRLFRRGADRPWVAILAACFPDLLAEGHPPVDRTLAPRMAGRALSLA